jgi:hypothetical protein
MNSRSSGHEIQTILFLFLVIIFCGFEIPTRKPVWSTFTISQGCKVWLMIIFCRTAYYREIFVGSYALLRAIAKVFPFITENSGCDFSQRVAQDAEIVGGGVFSRWARSRMPFAMLISIGTRAESSHLSSRSRVWIRARSCSGDSLGSLLLRSCLEGMLFSQT